MVKFTEIFQGPVVYDEIQDKTVGTYELREVLVNPNYIVFVRVAADLQNKTKNKGCSLIPDLHFDTPYTQILLHCSNRISPMYITVIGTMDHVHEKIMME